MKQLLPLSPFLLPPVPVPAQDTWQDTYCSPLNISYTYMIHNSGKDTSYRSSVDPTMVKFRGECYMLVTRSNDCRHSKDLLDWDSITPKNWYPQGSNVPAAHNYKDSVLYITGDPSGSMSIPHSDDPERGEWKVTPTILHNPQDPDSFIDDNGQIYMFWGPSNIYPIRGVELDKNHRFLLKGEVKKLLSLDMPRHGWERFGENYSDAVLGGYIEGPWLTKYNGRYYIQYGAPGTESNVHADGVYAADYLMGPYTYQKHNPVSYKPGGHMSGAGHGSTIQGPGGVYWHSASMVLSIDINWECRLCMSPAGFDKDGIMYVDTRFGDYPCYASAVPGKRGRFWGWMLLSYHKPVIAPTVKGGLGPAALTDELTKTFWSVEANDERQWVMIDPENPARVCAVRVNYHDYRSDMYGRIPGLRHRYVIEGSTGGETWNTLVDRKSSYKDTPNDYVELETPVTARYVRYRNIDVPIPSLAISELRVLGLGSGRAPRRPGKLIPDRHADRRDITIR